MLLWSFIEHWEVDGNEREALLNNNFWSGVINYIRVSAKSAETPVLTDHYIPVDKVLVFGTSVKELKDLTQIANQLNRLIGKSKWTIDLEDEDHVLRVVCMEYHEEEIIRIFNQVGFDCELMPY